MIPKKKYILLLKLNKFNELKKQTLPKILDIEQETSINLYLKNVKTNHYPLFFFIRLKNKKIFHHSENEVKLGNYLFCFKIK